MEDEKDEDSNELAGDDGDDLDGEDTGSRRGKDAAAYRELQGANDKLRADIEKRDRENQEFRERLARIEGEKSARQETNERTNSALEQADRRARQTAEALSKIAADDPERTVKIYTEIYKPLYEEIPKQAEAISRKMSRQTVDSDRQAEKQLEEAKRITLAELDKAGLDPEDYELVEALAIAKGTNDPEWFRKVKSEDQIPELVGMVKDRIVKNKRGSQDFKDEKREHRKPMNGVIEQGSSNRRSVRDQDDDDEPRGKGSILADMQRIRTERLKSTNRMLRQADNFR